MQRVRVAIRVDVPVERVWNLYADIERSPEWVPFAEEILYVSGPPGLGQVYRERTRLAGVANVAEWQIIEWDPPWRQVQRSIDNRVESLLTITMEPRDGGTILRQEVVIRSDLPRPLAWAQEVVFAAVGRYGIRAAVRSAKRRLETMAESQPVG